MTERKRDVSGRIVFTVLAISLLGGIAATVLVANDYRNLNLLLARFGFDPWTATTAERIFRPYELKGERIARPSGTIPERLIDPAVPMETQFIRTIRKDPRELCEALRLSGFPNAGWKAGGFDTESWECLSHREFPVEGQADASPKSSAFLAIRGNAETRVSSFRIKLNIENAATRDALTTAVIEAIQAFLEEVRWAEAPEIFADIRALNEFDVIRFGNRIQLKKEFSETPRYNFLITPDRSRGRNSYLPDYFDRSHWLPLPDQQ